MKVYNAEGNEIAIYKAIVISDINGFGDTTAADARAILRVAVELETFTSAQFKAADIDMNGKITADDARTVLRASVGLDSFH